MKDQILALAVPIIKEYEQFHRRDPKTGMVRSYADPASALGRAIMRAGKWQAYLKCLWEVPADMRGMSGAPWTIGWGTTGTDVGPDTVWSESKCNERFDRHVLHFLDKVLKSVGGYKLAANEIAACLSLAYNIGEGSFASSTLVRRLREGNKLAAADQFPRWNKAQGKVLNGLIRRRATERALFLGEGA